MVENGALSAEQSRADLVQLGSPEQLALNPELHGLTGDFRIVCDQLEAGASVGVAKKWREGSYYYFALKSPVSEKVEEFLLMWLFEYSGQVFAVFSYPAPVAAELDEPIYYVLKVSGLARLETIDIETMHRAAVNCFGEMTRVIRTEPDLITSIFGEFPTWQELNK